MSFKAEIFEKEKDNSVLSGDDEFVTEEEYEDKEDE